MGIEELLRVLQEEGERERRALRDGAAREADRVVGEARAAAARLRDAAVTRETAAREARVRAARDAVGLERQRALLRESRRQLDRLRAEALERLPGEVGEADVERFTAELLAEAGPVSAVLVVDPGSAAAARRAAQALGADPPPEVREAPAPRGGVELLTGTLVLDDTVASRLERAWPRVEPEIAGLLFAGDGASPREP